ncbi:cytochrome P450 [Streptosporangium sandarakinum]
MPLSDHTLPLLTEGYAWLPERRRTHGSTVVTRLMGHRATAVHGPDAARFFYDENHIRRHTALPEPIKSTLFGHGAVHTLDAAAHRVRKAMFTSLMTDDGIARLDDHAAAAWDKTAAAWNGPRPVTLFDEVGRILTRAACRWAGVPLDDADVPATARDLLALVDGFATLGPRHWRARAARIRLENRLARLIHDTRTGAAPAAPPGTPLAAVATHRDADGHPLDDRLAAVELLNLIRPTVAVTWYVTFAAHALHRHPHHRAALLTGDEARTHAFAQETRRFYPFAPFVGGKAVTDLTWEDHRIPEGSLVLLDIYGHNHDPRLWPDPHTFDPGRFLDRPTGEFDLIPQGGGDPRTGHRCPGEAITLTLLRTLTTRLARLDHDLPDQDLSISLRRIPTRPASGYLLANARPAA